MAEEILVSDGNIARLENILTLLIDEALALTEDELDEAEIVLAE
jgi:hypothetical protein